MGKYILSLFVLPAILVLGLYLMPAKATVIESGDLIKGQSFTAVYYYAENGQRYVFPNEKTYFTWYEDFEGVKLISDQELASIPIGGNVTYKPGYKMMKITTAPKVYVVEGGGVIRWVKTEQLAETFYGLNWMDWIDDVPDAFFTNYHEGESVEIEDGYDKDHQMTIYYTINHDKGFVY